LCYRVGRRGLHGALPMLVHALNDPESDVRDEAADALGRIGDPSTGFDLFQRYAVEDDLYVLQSLTWGLGYTSYRPAVPLLIDALAEADPCRRAYAAAALAALGATEARPAIRQALAREEASDWVKGHMRGAIDELAGG
jgi:HEAT repeat protein